MSDALSNISIKNNKIYKIISDIKIKNMTKRFIDAVKKCVEDGKLSTEERELLKKVAKEEGINETDAEVYIIGELKSKVKENEKRNAPQEKSSLVKDSLEIGRFLLTIITTAGPFIKDFLDKKKK